MHCNLQLSLWRESESCPRGAIGEPRRSRMIIMIVSEIRTESLIFVERNSLLKRVGRLHGYNRWS